MSELESTHPTQVEALLRAIENTIAEGGGDVVICVGEACPFPVKAEEENMVAGCPKCMRLNIDEAGNVTQFKVPQN